MATSNSEKIDDFRLYIFAFDMKCYRILNDMALQNVTLVPLANIMNERLAQIKEQRSNAEFC